MLLLCEYSVKLSILVPVLHVLKYAEYCTKISVIFHISSLLEMKCGHQEINYNGLDHLLCRNRGMIAYVSM